MKKMTRYSLMLACAFGVLGISQKSIAADGCCSGAKASGCPMQQLAPDANAALKPYPLDTCIVSGEKLGEMGKPFTFDYKGQEIKLCCKGCKKKFDKEPEKYLAKLPAEKK